MDPVTTASAPSRAGRTKSRRTYSSNLTFVTIEDVFVFLVYENWVKSHA